MSFQNIQIPAGFNIQALMANQAATQFALQQQAAAQAQQPVQVAAPAQKAKKKAPTAEDKREQSILKILDGKDPLGLLYLGLIQKIPSSADLEALVTHVRQKYGYNGYAVQQVQPVSGQVAYPPAAYSMTH